LRARLAAPQWYHPLGFAYAPDGAHDDKPELEPSVTMSSSACAEDNTCQAPRYFLGKEFLGETTGEISYPAAKNDGSFGLDRYEPTFQTGRNEWIAKRDETIEHGGWRVKLTLTDTVFAGDLFYFWSARPCHRLCRFRAVSRAKPRRTLPLAHAAPLASSRPPPPRARAADQPRPWHDERADQGARVSEHAHLCRRHAFAPDEGIALGL
jgi:hypothetical protein